jgi:hypothetical protein
MPATSERLERALTAIDAANRDDPHRIEVRGELRPKELAHAELASEWIERLVDEPSEELRLAARAHHLKRWSLSRSEYPEGRKGYLKWRQALVDLHAREAAGILADCGYTSESIQRVSHIIQRRNLSGDADSQALEDALCLIFFETQLEDLARRLEPEKMRDIGRKTLQKMSPMAQQLALELPIPDSHVALLRELMEDL